VAAVGLHLCAVVVMQQQRVRERSGEAPVQIAWAPPSTTPTPITLEVRTPPPAPPPAPSPAPSPSPASSSRPIRPAPAPSAVPTASSSSSPPSSSSSPPSPSPASSSSPSSAPPTGLVEDLAPRPAHLAHLPAGFGAPTLGSLVRGVDGRGPRQSTEGLRGALDYRTDEDEDAGKSGAALAAAKATRALKADIAFHDVTVGMASDWFREVRTAAERGFRPTSSDLDNPAEVAQAAIFANFLKDPSAWDEEAKRVLGPMLAATSLHSQDPIKRLALGTSASLGAAADSGLRRSTVLDLLTRKEAGLSVRFAFEVDVHHDGDGTVTAIDILRTATEKALQEKIRLAIDDAIRSAAPVPALVNGGQPFRSRWLFAATWFIDPPGCLLTPSDALGAVPGQFAMGCGGTFDVTSEGVKTSSFEVQQKVTAELLRIIPLQR
jgi:hypothetical protein